MKKKMIKAVGMLLIGLVVVIISRYLLLLNAYYEEIGGEIVYNYTMTQHPFYNGSNSIEFVNDGEDETTFDIWSNNITGSIDISIVDMDGKTYSKRTYSNDQVKESIHLPEGKYSLNIDCNSYTGAFCLAYMDFEAAHSFPNDRYQIISSEDVEGAEWDYILYVPETVEMNRLLVVPNNTGTESDSMLIHTESAKGLCTWVDIIADELGTPLLVPIFPRPKSLPDQYTHALNRAALLSEEEGLERLDLQLIAMIDHSKELLKSQEIELEDKNIMFGFSASGDFVDRFSILHPELVEAVAFGGSDNIVPLTEYNDVPLPYPIGTYDYEAIMGRAFDETEFSNIKRMIFKGTLDEGGWMTIDDEEGKTVYTGEEYYKLFVIPKIEERIKTMNKPFEIEKEVTHETLENISYLAYDGDTFVTLFKTIKGIYSENHLENHEFYVYEGIEHHVTVEIQDDVLAFFMRVLKK